MPAEDTELNCSNDAILILDLEDFIAARSKTVDYKETSIQEDLTQLLRFAHQISYPARVSIRRAYAFFGQHQTKTQNIQGHIANALSANGIQSVMLSDISGVPPRQNACMQMAVETVSAITEHKASHAIFVTGDTSFIPVLVQIRSQGGHASVIGLKDHTPPLLERYCDQFVFFEDLQTAEQTAGPWANPHVLHATRHALRQILIQAAQHTMPLGAIGNLVDRNLQSKGLQPFSHDGEDLKEVFQRYASALSIKVIQSDNNDEPMVQLLTSKSLVPCHVSGPKIIQQASQNITSKPNPIATNTPPTHSIEHYAYLLRTQQPKIYRLPMPLFEAMAKSAWDIAYQNNSRITVQHFDMADAIQQVLDGMTIDGHVPRPQALLYQAYKSGCFTCVEDGPFKGTQDFHWALPAQISDDIEHFDTFKERILLFILENLADRLDQIDHTEIDTSVLVKFFYEDDQCPEHMAYVEHLLDHIYEDTEE